MKTTLGTWPESFAGELGGEDWGGTAGDEFARVAAVEEGDGGAVGEMVVGGVVDEEDAGGGEDGWGAGLDDAGVETVGAAGEDGGWGFLGPVQEIGRG